MQYIEDVLFFNRRLKKKKKKKREIDDKDIQIYDFGVFADIMKKNKRNSIVTQSSLGDI